MEVLLIKCTSLAWFSLDCESHKADCLRETRWQDCTGREGGGLGGRPRGNARNGTLAWTRLSRPPVSGVFRGEYCLTFCGGNRYDSGCHWKAVGGAPENCAQVRSPATKRGLEINRAAANISLFQVSGT